MSEMLSVAESGTATRSKNRPDSAERQPEPSGFVLSDNTQPATSRRESIDQPLPAPPAPQIEATGSVFARDSKPGQLLGLQGRDEEDKKHAVSLAGDARNVAVGQTGLAPGVPGALQVGKDGAAAEKVDFGSGVKGGVRLQPGYKKGSVNLGGISVPSKDWNPTAEWFLSLPNAPFGLRFSAEVEGGVEFANGDFALESKADISPGAAASPEIEHRYELSGSTEFKAGIKATAEAAVYAGVPYLLNISGGLRAVGEAGLTANATVSGALTTTWNRDGPLGAWTPLDWELDGRLSLAGQGSFDAAAEGFLALEVLTVSGDLYTLRTTSKKIADLDIAALVLLHKDARRTSVDTQPGLADGSWMQWQTRMKALRASKLEKASKRSQKAFADLYALKDLQRQIATDGPSDQSSNPNTDSAITTTESASTDTTIDSTAPDAITFTEPTTPNESTTPSDTSGTTSDTAIDGTASDTAGTPSDTTETAAPPPAIDEAKRAEIVANIRSHAALTITANGELQALMDKQEQASRDVVSATRQLGLLAHRQSAMLIEDQLQKSANWKLILKGTPARKEWNDKWSAAQTLLRKSQKTRSETSEKIKQARAEMADRYEQFDAVTLAEAIDMAQAELIAASEAGEDVLKKEWEKERSKTESGLRKRHERLEKLEAEKERLTAELDSLLPETEMDRRTEALEERYRACSDAQTRAEVMLRAAEDQLVHAYATSSLVAARQVQLKEAAEATRKARSELTTFRVGTVKVRYKLQAELGRVQAAYDLALGQNQKLNETANERYVWLLDSVMPDLAVKTGFRDEPGR